MASAPDPSAYELCDKYEIDTVAFINTGKTRGDKDVITAQVFRDYHRCAQKLNTLVAHGDEETTDLIEKLTTMQHQLAQRNSTVEDMARDIKSRDGRLSKASTEMAKLKRELDRQAIDRSSSPSGDMSQVDHDAIVHELKEQNERLIVDIANAKSLASSSSPSPQIVQDAALLEQQSLRIQELELTMKTFMALANSNPALAAASGSPPPPQHNRSDVDIPDAALYHLITPFTGTAENSTIADFPAYLVDFELQVQHLSPQGRLKYLITTAKGDARDTIVNLPSEVRTNYDQLVATLKERYPARYSVKQVHNMLRSARQQNNETVNQFANRFRSLGDRAKPELDRYLVNEEALKIFLRQKFLDGVHRSITSVLFAHNHSDDVDDFDLQKCIDECRKIEEYAKSNRTSSDNPSFPSSSAKNSGRRSDYKNGGGSYNSSYNNSDALGNTGKQSKTASAMSPSPLYNNAGDALKSITKMASLADNRNRSGNYSDRSTYYRGNKNTTSTSPSTLVPAYPPPPIPNSANGNVQSGHRGQYVNGISQMPSDSVQISSSPSSPPSSNRGVNMAQDSAPHTVRSTYDSDSDYSANATFMPNAADMSNSVAPMTTRRTIIEGVMVTSTPLDTGSCVNVMSEEMFKEICAARPTEKRDPSTYYCSPPTSSIVVVGGGVKPVTAGVRLTVRFPSGEDVPLIFCIMEHSTTKILIGTPGLHMLGVKLITPERPGVNLINHRSTKDGDGMTVRPYPIVCTNTTVIPPHSSASIPSSIGSPQSHYVQGCNPALIHCNLLNTVCKFEQSYSDPGLEISPKILNNEHLSSPFEIYAANVCNDKIRVKKGDIVGYCNQVSQETCDEQFDSSSPSPPMFEVPSTIAQDRVQFINENLKPFGSQLTEEEKSSMHTLIMSNAHLVSMGLNDLPMCSGPPMEIDTGDSQPFAQKCRKTPIAAQMFLKNMVKEMLANKIIVPSSSPYCSPVTIAPKKVKPPKEPWRFCVDFRWLNRVTIRQSVRVPQIADMVRGLRGKRYISTFDLSSAYWQLGLTADASEKTTFICPLGVFRFLRMPYGLTNAPAYYIRMIEEVLAPLISEYGPLFHDTMYVGVYLDDIIIASSTFEEHLFLMSKLFALLSANNLKLGISKCSFCVEETLYLGWYVSAEGKRPNPDQTVAISRLPTPRTIKDVRSFLGMINYYRECMPNTATIAIPLYKLTKPKVKFVWTEEAQQAFSQLKLILQEETVLAHPDPNKPFELFTDGSDIGIAAILEQKDAEGVNRPIGYFSHKLNPCEQRYSTNEKETYAVIAGLRFFRQYIIGNHVDVYTDHSALIPLLSSPRESHRLSRWRSEFGEFDVTLHFRRGKDNINADYLSRYPICSPERQCVTIRHGDYYVQAHEEVTKDIPLANAVDMPDVINAALLEHKSILEAQLKCEEVRKLKTTLITDAEQHSTLAVSGEVLLSIDHLGRGTFVPYIPVSMREAVVNQAHSSPVSGHLHNPKLYELLAKRCAWPNMRVDIAKWVEKCETCIKTYPGHRLRPHLAPFITEGRLQRIVMDVVQIGPSASGITHAVVFTDHLTRFPIVVPIIDQSAESLLDALITHVIQYHGVPEEIVADMHPSHISQLFSGTCEALGIRTNFSRGYSHRHAGQAERFNRSLLQMLRRASEAERDWTIALPWVLLEYRESICTSTGYSPAFLTYGRNLRLPLDRILSYKSDAVVDEPSRIQTVAATLERAMRNVKHTNADVRARMIETYRKQNGTKASDLKEGDLVFVKDEREMINRPGRKLYKTPYTGPYKVTEVDPPLVHVSQLDDKGERTVHMSDAVKAKHHVTPHYGTKRIPRHPQPIVPPSHVRNTDRYDLRPRKPTVTHAQMCSMEFPYNASMNSSSYSPQIAERTYIQPQQPIYSHMQMQQYTPMQQYMPLNQVMVYAPPQQQFAYPPMHIQPYHVPTSLPSMMSQSYVMPQPMHQAIVAPYNPSTAVRTSRPIERRAAHDRLGERRRPNSGGRQWQRSPVRRHRPPHRRAQGRRSRGFQERKTRRTATQNKGRNPGGGDSSDSLIDMDVAPFVKMMQKKPPHPRDRRRQQDNRDAHTR